MAVTVVSATVTTTTRIPCFHGFRCQKCSVFLIFLHAKILHTLHRKLVSEWIVVIHA